MREVKELVKLPFPLPSEVLLFEIVGPVEVFQQTPLAVIAAPPSAEIFPPEVAVVPVIDVAFEVVIVGRFARTVNDISLP